jgi:hypothetical protein
MQDFEKLGVFYLGREYDLTNKRPKETLVLYDSKDLVTHAVCVGMTGSGKTGLCISLLEEAAIDNIPAIIIDPKGDLANLLLTFPDLTAEDFRPWLNQDDAAKKGIAPDEFARQQSEMWKRGLENWGESGARIKKLKDAADFFIIYTPGSNAGIPVSILKSFAAPPAEVIEDNESFTGKISSTATSLLGLIGIDADPLKSREHILLSTILANAWKNGQDLDLATLIHQIQDPPVKKVGVLDLDSFFPSKDRVELSLAINNLLAAPSFSAWLEGVPLDIGEMLHSGTGKPRHAIFSIAHLNDAERMFFVSLILNQTLAWMRTQAGTTSLRALLYMDEIFGYFPPVSNPPSKLPLLTLLKQARAFGLGIVLATQNPVDLDYKGLSNTGTWFIGRLQTERDKARVLEGLEGAASTQGSSFDKQKMEQTLAGLGSRIFLMNNVHEDEPVVFETRWALSYLCGPLTRSQIKSLMDPIRSDFVTSSAPAGKSGKRSDSPAAVSSLPMQTQSGRPLVPPDIQEYFIPLRTRASGAQSLVYLPVVYGAGEVRVSDSKSGADTALDTCVLCAITNDPVPLNWDEARTCDIDTTDLEKDPAEGHAVFGDLPSIAVKAKSYAGWTKDFSNWMYRSQAVTIFKSPSSDIFSNPGESERDFRVRLQQANRESRDGDVEALRKKYAPKIAGVQERLRRAQQAQQLQAEQAKSAKVETAISFGATLLSGLFGRKAVSLNTVGRATTAARGVARSMKESADVGRAGETVEAVSQQLQELNAQLESEIAQLVSTSDPAAEKLESISLKPKKKDITIKLVGLAWAPHLQESGKRPEPAW